MNIPIYLDKKNKKAFELYKKSANQGYAQAQFNLGNMYYKGQGVKQDYKKARELWQKLADQGFAQAQSNASASNVTRLFS